jgi:hypothetical protein
MCERSVLLLEEEDDDEQTTESTIMIIIPSAATPLAPEMVRTVVAWSLDSTFPADDAYFCNQSADL